MDTEFELEWQKSKDKEFTRLFWDKFKLIQCFGLQYTVFFPTCHALITWFELSRVKLYRNDLKGNKNYFELVGGLFCRTFVIPVALCNKLDVDGRRTSNPIISIIIGNDNSNSPTIMIIIIMIRSIERFSAPIYQVGRASGAEETVHIASTAVFRLQDLQLFLCERYLETMR